MDNKANNDVVPYKFGKLTEEKAAELDAQIFNDTSSDIVAVAGAVTTIVSAIEGVVEDIASASVSLAQIEKEMYAMDLQFDAYIADLEQKLSKYEISAPIVREQLNSLDKKMDRILDTVLLIDTDDEKKLDYKMKLLDTLNNYTDKMSRMMVQLL